MIHASSAGIRSGLSGARAWVGVAARIGLLAATAATAAWSAAAAEPAKADREACHSGSAEAAVAACRRVLEQRPADVDARLAMGDALTQLNRYQDAVNLLRQGLDVSPGDSRIQRKLRLVESYLQEQKLIDERSRQPSQGQATKPEVTLQLERVRCTSLSGEAALKACEKALQLAPEDAALHRARGDALLAMDLAGRAVVAYREALKIEPSNPAATQALERAQSRQKRQLTDCQSGSGESALRACDRARIAGAPEEATIQVRRGEILQEMGKSAEAEQAFESALKLDPANAQAAAKLAALRKPKEPVAAVAAAPDVKQEATVRTPVATPQASPQAPRQSAAAATSVAGAQPARAQPKTDTPRRYSNLPTVAGVTH